jgi:aspartate-semialdehyde dehydrogenase
VSDLESLKERLEKITDLIAEAYYYIDALEEESYVDSDDENKLNEELEKILKDLGIELEYEE